MKNKNLDILNDEHLKMILTGVESEDNKTRKLHAWKAFNCLEGNQKQYVKEELKTLYPETHGKFRVGDLLIVKKVIKKLSKAYKQDPIRRASTDKETEELEKIYDDNGFKRAWKEFDRIFNLHKYACLWLKYLNDDAKYNLQALAPYEYDLVRDEVTGKPLVFILSYPDNETTNGSDYADGVESVTTESQADTSADSKIYSIWSAKNFVRVKAKQGAEDGSIKVEKLINENNLNNENEAGVLPIHFESKDTAVDYPIPSNLSDQSISWNISFSDYKTGSAAQGHGILTYSYPDSMKPNSKLHTGMHTAISLPQSTKPNAPETKAEYINANPSLADQLDGLKFEAVNILDDHGITNGSSIQGQDADSFASGFDRVLAGADVQDEIEGNQSIYVLAEQGLFNLLSAYERALNKNTFSEKQKLNVTFLKPTILISDAETLTNIETRDRLGLSYPWEKHQILDPNLSDADAQKRELEISTLKQKELLNNQALLSTDENNDDEDEDEA